MTTHRVLIAAAAAVWLQAVGAGQTPAPQGRGAQPQPIVPIAVSVLAHTPERYLGSTVSLTAAVEERFGATAFSIDQGNSKGSADILVLAPVLTAPLEPGSYVTVIGEVVRFDVAGVAARMKDAMPVLGPDAIAKYRGQPAIVATSVINRAMTDLAKRPPPPMSPEEQALSGVMKQINPGLTALRQSVTASHAADVRMHASALSKLFGEAAAFWKAKPHTDAIQWTEDARRESGAIAAAAERGDWDAVKASVPKLQSACQTCHGRYRERLDDGTYRFKPPAK